MSQQTKSQQQASLNVRLKMWARKLKEDIIALYFALRHPATPWYARIVAAIVVGYALSPIDLVPDFIPVLGYIDDVILLPLGIALTIKLIPEPVLAICREEAVKKEIAKPKIWLAAVVIMLIWVVVFYGIYSAFR